MKTDVKLARIGNSRGIRLSKAILNRYGIGESVEMETTPDAIILRPSRTGAKVGWEESYRQMAASGEDWSEWEGVAEDGLEDVR